MKYKTRDPGIVTAVQFFRENPPKEATMVWSAWDHFVRNKKDCKVDQIYHEEYVVENSYSDNVLLKDTNWIVTHENGCANIMEDWEFKRVYRELGTKEEEHLRELLDEPT